MGRKLEFTVSICLGGGYGGDICVEVEVTDKEYELLKKCCREGEEIESFKGLKPLYKRIVAAARDESEDFDPEDADYGIEIPDEVYEAVESEDEI